MKSEIPSGLSECIPCLTMLYNGPITFMSTVIACVQNARTGDAANMIGSWSAFQSHHGLKHNERGRILRVMQRSKILCEY